MNTFCTFIPFIMFFIFFNFLITILMRSALFMLIRQDVN